MLSKPTVVHSALALLHDVIATAWCWIVGFGLGALEVYDRWFRRDGWIESPPPWVPVAAVCVAVFWSFHKTRRRAMLDGEALRVENTSLASKLSLASDRIAALQLRNNELAAAVSNYREAEGRRRVALRAQIEYGYQLVNVQKAELGGSDAWVSAYRVWRLDTAKLLESECGKVEAEAFHRAANHPSLRLEELSGGHYAWLKETSLMHQLDYLGKLLEKLERSGV